MLRHRSVSALLVATVLAGAASAHAQNRGVYPLGMTATNSGVTPESGFSYVNQVLFYARDEQRGPDGEVLATGNQSVILAMNSLVWVSRATVLGGAKLSMSATLPITNNALSGNAAGAISGGGGFGDSYYQPVILGWQGQRGAARLVYGFLAPTGSFDPDSNRNTGSGYWTHAVSSGQTWHLTASRAASISAFAMYEFHTRQSRTGVVPGQTLNIDYSLAHSASLPRHTQLQAGLVGYGQWQTTATHGPAVTTVDADARYRVNAIGFVTGALWPERGVSLSVKYFKEFACRSTFQGYSTQVSGSIHF